MNQSVGIWATLLRLRALDTFLLPPPAPPSGVSKRADVGCSRTLLSFLWETGMELNLRFRIIAKYALSVSLFSLNFALALRNDRRRGRAKIPGNSPLSIPREQYAQYRSSTGGEQTHRRAIKESRWSEICHPADPARAGSSTLPHRVSHLPCHPARAS